MEEKIQGSRLRGEGWGWFQGRSRIGPPFRGHLQGSADNLCYSEALYPYIMLLFRILERLHSLHPAENTYVSLTSDSLYTSLQV